MAKITINDLLEAGVHFGHQSQRRNPKMKPYIYGTRHKVTIFDLTITMRKLAEACEFLRQVAGEGNDILFVGTKRQAQTVARQAAEKTNMFYVVHRWLGGMLTNNKVISSRIKYLKQLQQMAEDGSLDELPNKEASSKRREMAKLERTIGGMAGMSKLPAAMVVVDVLHEDIAIREARKCGIPVVALVDSNCNPDPIDYVIPGNDDALRSIKIIIQALTAAVEEGLLESGREVNADIQFAEEEQTDESKDSESTASADEAPAETTAETGEENVTQNESPEETAETSPAEEAVTASETEGQPEAAAEPEKPEPESA